jgi:hypothetical protein
MLTTSQRIASAKHSAESIAAAQRYIIAMGAKPRPAQPSRAPMHGQAGTGA